MQIKRREQEFLFVTMKGEKKEIESIIEKEGKRREENKKKQGKEAKKPSWPLFFFFYARISSQGPGAATAVLSPSPILAPGKSMHSLCFAF